MAREPPKPGREEEKTAMNDEWTLTVSQQKAVSLALNGKNNLFITGGAGCGKSTVIRRITDTARDMGKNVLVCASTGVAAMNIGEGMTVHAAFGFPAEPCIIDEGPEKGLHLRVTAPKLVKLADIIIVDEISMVSPDVMDSIVLSLRKCEEASVRKKKLIVVGDFLQMPPVVTEKYGHKGLLEAFYGKHDSWYAFMGLYWDSCDFEPIYLKEVVRQTDKEFVECLGMIRKGDPSCLDYINRAYERKPPQGAVALYSYTSSVSNKNDSCLREIKGELYTQATQVCYEEGYNEGNLPRHLSACIPPDLSFKVGASIIFTATDYDGSCSLCVSRGPANGAQGSPNFVNGMAGVITSVHQRGRSVTIKTEKGAVIKVRPMERRLYDFQSKNSRLEKCRVASFIQYPFIISYAITIHRAQGQTLGSVIVCPDTFSPAQLYVALSRVTTFEGLYLTRPIREEDLKVDRSVLAFYTRLEKKAGISASKGRPVKNADGSRRDTLVWVPNALASFARDALRLNRVPVLEGCPDPVRGRVRVRASERLAADLQVQIDSWRAMVKDKKTQKNPQAVE